MQPETVAGSEAHDRGDGAGGAAAAAEAWLDARSRPPVTVIRRSRGLFDLNLPGLWAYRELLFFLIWRDIKVKYKQAAIGLLWVVLQPVMQMIVFTIVFNRLAGVKGQTGVPYPLFVFSGLLPWTLFANGLTQVTTSVVGNAGLISKVYFPRLIIPVASVVAGLVDFAVSLVVLGALMAYYHHAPDVSALAIPLFILIAIASALAAGLWLSMLNVRFRDVQYTIPFLTQALLFLSPVAYSTSIVPVHYRALLGINPMTAVVEGFRWAFIGGAPPWSHSFIASLVMVGILLVTGVLFFRRQEKTFADLI
ncbi:MAG TPA: ABC transporter permease [Gaiellaceae bacterium]|nr:ABC transporter permease [Gaiellaceae bacterium]